MHFPLEHGTWQATAEFISRHATESDTARLALLARGEPDVDLHFALDQIAGRQRAKDKLPSWAGHDNIIYPPRLAMEQCSGEATARYKASLASAGDLMVDLTGGFGIDCAAIATRFSRAIYVEQNPTLCAIARHNFATLGLRHIEVVNDTAEHFLTTLDNDTDLIYLDPARRDSAGRRTYAISDCTPDVAQLAPTLLHLAKQVIVKLSPMLDLRHVATHLPGVNAIHIIGSGGECKELLAILSNQPADTESIAVTCHHITTTANQTLHFPLAHTNQPAPVWSGDDTDARHLFEPNPTLMKAGATALLAKRFGLTTIARDSHLLVGPNDVPDFPGRRFNISAVTSMNKKALRTALNGITRANVAVRNFPLTAPELRQRLHLADGGENYIFGTRLNDGQTRIFICTKAE